MAEFLNEQFAGTDGDALTTYNASWVKISGYPSGLMSLLSGKARHSSGTTASGYYRSDVVAPGADYSVSADLTITAAISTAALGVCGRVVGTANTMYYARINASAGVSLLKYVGGTATTLSSTPSTFVTGTSYNLRLEMLGSQISVYLDGVLVVSATDSAVTGPGYVGMRGVNSSSVIGVDNLRANTAEVSSGTTTTVTPGAGALAVQGYAPTVAQSASQAVSPAPAALTVRGYAPTIAQVAAGTRVISPGAGALRVQGFAPTIAQPGQSTGTPPDSGTVGGDGGAGGGGGSIREVRAFADELDRARKPTKGERKRRKQAIEAAVLELLPDEPAAEVAAPYITQLVARNLPPATWAPVHGPRAITLSRAVVEDVRARVAEWLRMQELLAEIEDDFETELLLMG